MVRMMFNFITFATIIVLVMLIFAETMFYNRDVRRYEQKISDYRAVNAKLITENQMLRGEDIVKTANDFARDCGKE